MRVRYFELPIVLKYNPVRNIYIGLGPYFALKLSGELTLWEEEKKIGLNKKILDLC